MEWDAVGAIAEVLGVIAVVVSLIYVGFQVRQNTIQLRQDNLLETVRGTLDTNWYFHRDSDAFGVFQRGVKSFDDLAPRDQAHFHSILVDLAFYLEMVRNMEGSGLVDKSALETNSRFLAAVLVTPGGRQWLEFAQRTQPMPPTALDYLQSLLNSAEDTPPITELQPWFSSRDE
ncbi:MAG: hypothetical protein QNJ07_09250 [Woeseiaceae bacterium]|nr:hypothetical protein [Woeseiaceae bacterium]